MVSLGKTITTKIMLITYLTVTTRRILNKWMKSNEIRIRLSDLTYNYLKSLSVKVGLPITKLAKNIIVNKLMEMKGNK